ncbi:TylF/MycF/NovP-related O-methyltransferase [Sulfuricurvum sp.]|uniref:TylF/MycF/NovP-related O-methyltransferase n=1 Tax=Sulfuricurvum sp. TaxID=2025608 RepID=UPI002618D8B0|nr:TylF/MycF/NovP-related O-methyltransferase [Sulfuricurvum sp.]MDD2267526.1 macrocin O-methyltransferase [Sulfuricurvum sp.]MDD2783680.1 macrocin O-methyltransferase [Sulfuricurvum sp.]
MNFIKKLVIKIMEKNASILSDKLSKRLEHIENQLNEIKYNDPRRPEYLFYKVCEVAQKKTIDYIYENMKNAICIVDYDEFLSYCVSKSRSNGDIFEFGVFSGYSINKFACLSVSSNIYGFDSFEGLPEEWQGYHFFDFNRNGKLPNVQSNVTLIKGWFSDTLPVFLKVYKGEGIKLLHIDCDLYSSTKDVFNELAKYITKDMIIIFDEYFNYPNFENHELKAFHEFVQKQRINYEYIAYCGERVAVKIL